MKPKVWTLLSLLFFAPLVAQNPAAAQPAPSTTAAKPEAPVPQKAAAPAKPAQPKPATAQLSSQDAEINTILAQIKDGKLATSAMGPLSGILTKLSSAVIGQQIIDIQTAGKAELPAEFSKTSAIAFQGKIDFLKQPVTCTVLIGKEKDATGQSKLGFSLEIALDKNYTVNDFNFLTALGVKGADLGKFGTINLPQPSIIFSTLLSYTNPKTKSAIKAGLTISTKTQVTSLMKIIRGEVNNLTGGNANKVPFIAKVNDTTPVTFNVAVGFTGSKFESFGCNIALPMSVGVDMEKLRAQERSFNPKIAAPFNGLNKPIKDVTGVINQAPLKDIKTIAIENFIASVGVEINTFKISFGAELNVTTNANTRYGMLATVGLSPEEIAIELRKSPSIKSMPLGNGVSIDNIALAVIADFKVLATTGVPISGLGILGEITFPFEGDKVSIGLAGQADVSGDFMMMGSVKNLDAKKLAVFNAQLIENLARKVNFNTSALTEAMKQMPTIKINDGYVYFATKQISLGGRLFPLGFGVTLDVDIDKQKGRLSVAGNQKQLTFLGYLSKISIPAQGPIIVFSGAGLDKKSGTPDDGPIIDFAIYADKPTKSKFDMSAEIALPPVNVSGKGDVSLKIAGVATKFTGQIGNLFKADFDFAFDIMKIAEAKIAFALNTEERKNFLATAFKQLEKAIEKAQKGAAKVMLEPLRIVAKEIGKGLSNLDVGIPKKIAASLVAKTWSGSLEIDGGSLKLPVIGEIKLGIPKIEFSLKDPAKAIAAIAEKWANQIVDDMKKLGKKLEEFGKEIEKGAKVAIEETKKAAEKTGKAIETGAKETGKAIETGAKETGKAAEKAGKAIESGAKTAAKETGKAAKKAGTTIKEGAEKVGGAIAGVFAPKKKKSKKKTQPMTEAQYRRLYFVERTELMDKIKKLEKSIKKASESTEDRNRFSGQTYFTADMILQSPSFLVGGLNDLKRKIENYNRRVTNNAIKNRFKPLGGLPEPINVDFKALESKIRQIRDN